VAFSFSKPQSSAVFSTFCHSQAEQISAIYRLYFVLIPFILSLLFRRYRSLSFPASGTTNTHAEKHRPAIASLYI